jgi:hypothetical protein
MKFGRNDQCPCGSGKKLKKCCIQAYQDLRRPDTPGIDSHFVDAKYVMPDDYDAHEPADDDGRTFGYATERRPDTNIFFDAEEADPVCQIITVTVRNQAELVAITSQPAPLDSIYVVDSELHDGRIVVFGPFDELGDAYQLAHEKFGAIRFNGPVTFSS